MEDLKQIQEFFSKPLNEGKQLDIEDFAKVVQAVTKTGHPVTVLLVPKFNEIEIITGMNAPDDMLRDLSDAVDSLGYGRNDIFIAADSSNLSRREYSDIRRVNGGHKDYFEESVNEVKRPEPDYKQLVKLLIMAFKHEPKARFYFNRNNGVVYFDLIGGAAYSPKKSKMRDIFGGMNPIAVNREFGRADHYEEETIKQVEQLSNGKIKAEIKELGDGVLYKLASVNKSPINELDIKTYRSAVEKGLGRGDDKGREIAQKAIELMGKSLSKELKDVTLVIKPIKIEPFHRNYFSGKPPMTGQYQIKFTGAGSLHKPDLNLDTKDITLFVKAELGQAKEYGGWGGPVELDRYIGWKPITLQLSIRNGSVEVYPYGSDSGMIQFTRQGSRLIAKIAKEMNLSMGGDGDVKHNAIKQFTPYKNEPVNETTKEEEGTSIELKPVGRDTGIKLNLRAIKKHLEKNGYTVNYSKGSSMVNPKVIDVFNPNTGNSIVIARNGELFGDGNWGVEVSTDKEAIQALKQFENELNESKPLKENTFKVGQKVTYLGHPAVVTATKEYNGRNFVSVSYDKGTGKTKASDILATSGDVKPLNEAQFTDYSNNELAAYVKELSKQRADATSKGQSDLLGGINKEIEAATRELKKRSQALKGLTRTDVNEGAVEIMDAYNDVMDLVKKHSRNLSDDDSYALGLKLKAWFEKNILSEEKKLTYNDFISMVRADMNAGSAPDEYVSDERVRKDAKYLYNRYLQGASLDDLFEATKEEENEFHKKLDKLVHKTFGHSSDEKKYKKGDKLKIKLKNGKEFDVIFDKYLAQDGMAFGKIKDEDGEFDTKPFALDTVVEYNTGIYYHPDKEKYAKKKTKKSLKEKEITVDDNAEFKLNLKHLLDKHLIQKEDLSDYEEKEADYDELYSNYLYKIVKEVATEKGYSKYLKSKDNPKGETDGLDTKTMNKILMNIVKDIKETNQIKEGASTEEKRIAMSAIKRIAKYRGVDEDEARNDLIRAAKELGSLKEAIKEIFETIELGKNLNEELCPKGKAYIKKRKAAGEKSSAYLSGRAVKVCKGQMKG